MSFRTLSALVAICTLSKVAESFSYPGTIQNPFSTPWLPLSTDALASIGTHGFPHLPLSMKTKPGQKPEGKDKNRVNTNTLLRYKNLSREEEEVQDARTADDNWVTKWFEEHFPSKFSWTSPGKKQGKNKNNSFHHHESRHAFARSGGTDQVGTSKQARGKVEIDNEMQGCTITHLDSSGDDLMNDIEILPSRSVMLHCLGDRSRIPSSSNTADVAVATKTNLYNGWRQKIMRIKKKDDEVKRADLGFTNPVHAKIMTKDLTRSRLAISIASNIETPEQWIEFCENGGGLKHIVQCIHDVADEIRQGYATDVFESDGMMLDHAVRRENAFQTACSACRVLRDLSAKDSNWASAITDEMLQLNKRDDVDHGTRSGGRLISDLVMLLRHTNEAELFYSRKVWRKRRELRSHGISIKNLKSRRERRDSRRRCSLYINQLFLGMAIASDNAICTFRETPDFLPTVRRFSSYTRQEKLLRRWVKYPMEKTKRIFNALRNKGTDNSQTAFLAAASVQPGIIGEIQGTSNQLLAALGHNVFVPKSPGQKGLRILSLDGGGTRGIASISIMESIVEAMGGVEVCDAFDIIAGTSTGAIIAFLVGLRRESNALARKRYNELIKKIFVKGALSKPMLVFTTATYSEVPFKNIMLDILGDKSMLDSRRDPRVPLVFCVSAKMTSTTSKLSLFRNYNYAGGETKDKFVVDPEEARRRLGFPPSPAKENNNSTFSNEIRKASRHEGSMRVLQRAALRATTAAPTVFKPVLLGGDMYSDGGIVASNPAAVAIHEARTLFPDVPIEMLVSVGTGEFVTQKISPSFGWDGIISQIVKSATDTAKTHWVLQDILGQGRTANGGKSVSSTNYYRFDPIVGTPQDFPIDGTDPDRLEALAKIASDYMEEPEQQKKLKGMTDILKGKTRRFPF